ncbi:hypothetical protein ACFQX7_32835 [Luedemannella flava]
MADLDGLDVPHRVGGHRDAAGHLDPGQVVGVVAGEPGHGRGPAGGGERHGHVLQGGAAADGEQASVRVGDGELAVADGVQVEEAGPHVPAPRLGVVDRRGVAGRGGGVDQGRRAVVKVLGHAISFPSVGSSLGEHRR